MASASKSVSCDKKATASMISQRMTKPPVAKTKRRVACSNGKRERWPNARNKEPWLKAMTNRKKDQTTGKLDEDIKNIQRRN